MANPHANCILRSNSALTLSAAVTHPFHLALHITPLLRTTSGDDTKSRDANVALDLNGSPTTQNDKRITETNFG